MKPDSLASVLSVNLPADALPWPILAILLVGFFCVMGYALSKASAFKVYASDFPSQAAPVVLGLVLTIMTAPVILSRMALGMDQVEGTGDWLAFLAVVMGVAGVGALAVKRFSSPEYQEGKARAEAAKAAATPPQVNVAGDASVQTAAPTHKPPVVAATKLPAAGVKPSDPDVRKGLEQLAAGIAGPPSEASD